VTLDIALRALFGASATDARRSGSEDDPARVGRAATAINDHFTATLGNPLAPPRWVPTPRNRALARAIAELDAVVANILAPRRATPASEEPRDLLGMLLAARDDDGAAMDDRQL